MKFMVIYRERRADFDPAAAQRRAARLRNERAMPPGLRVHQLVARVAGGGGYAVVETAHAADLQHLAAMFSDYDCRIEPLVDIAFAGGRRHGTTGEGRASATWRPLPDMPPTEPHEGAFSDDDVYDTED